jgi:nucleolar protein 56
MYLYSNILGTFVFSQNFDIREKVLFSDKEAKANFDLMDKGELLESEKIFLKKFKTIENLRETRNQKAMERVHDALKEYYPMFHELNIYITKNQVRETIADDLLIIQASDSIAEINKTINILAKRLREWYLYVLPELEDKIEDNEKFVHLLLTRTRKELEKDFNIKPSMGKELKKVHSDEINDLAKTISVLYKQKESKEKYLESLMRETCPNITEVAGSLIGAKLIAIAGSLRNIVMMPASTIQLLGAEKALFRHMLNKKINPPKHGVIINHPLISGSPQSEHGKRARALADKISMAAKVDFFKGKFIGDKLKKELEERFK